MFTFVVVPNRKWAEHVAREEGLDEWRYVMSAFDVHGHNLSQPFEVITQSAWDHPLSPPQIEALGLLDAWRQPSRMHQHRA